MEGCGGARNQAMGDRDAPTKWGRCIACRSLLADFVADHAADGSAAYGSDCAAARQDRTAGGTDTGTDRGAFVLRRHAGTSTQANQEGDGNCAKCEFLYRFHGIPLMGWPWERCLGKPCRASLFFARCAA